jgi:hypothetical protein
MNWIGKKAAKVTGGFAKRLRCRKNAAATGVGGPVGSPAAGLW